MTAPTTSILMLTAVHLPAMLPMPVYLWRFRRLERVIKRQPGLVRAHRWLSRRSLLLMSWWQDREAAEAWLQHPALQALLRRAQGYRGTSVWTELFEPMSEGAWAEFEGNSPGPRT